jgi:hypothetical protein
MKKIRLFLGTAILLAGLAMSTAEAVAQQAAVTAQAPAVYQYGVLKDIGNIADGTSVPLQFLNVGFYAPAGTQFTDASFALVDSTKFYLTDKRIGYGPNGANTHLMATINFWPDSTTSYGYYADMLVISAAGALSFYLPLRGRYAPFSIEYAAFVDFGNVAAGKTTAIADAVVINAWEDQESLVFKFKSGSGSIFQTYTSSATDTTVTLAVRVVNPSAGSDGTVYTDALVVSSTLYPQITYEIPVKATALRVNPTPGILYFKRIPVNVTKTLNVRVQVNPGQGVSINTLSINPGNGFTVTPLPGWSSTAGGVLAVSFTPTDYIIYNATLTLSGDGFAPVNILLNGGGTYKPVISANPDYYDFGEVPVGTTVNSNEITVTLFGQLNQLTDPGSFTFANPNTPFDVVSVYRERSTANVFHVTLSFTPTEEAWYDDYLIVHADYADDYYFPLYGEGVFSKLRGATQATAISTQEMATASVSVKNGDITIFQAPAGSTVKVYNLQGQLLKTQPVSSDVEILETAAWPKGIYLVVLKDDQQEILKQKVIL